MVYRIFVEKKKELANEAKALLSDIRSLLLIKGVTDVRILNRYAVEQIEEELFLSCKSTVFSEPQTDLTYTDPEYAGRRTQYAVGNGDVLTGVLLILDPHGTAADGDGVIAGIDDTVGNGDEAAGVDVDAVTVAVIGRTEDLDTANRCHITAVEEQTPAGQIAQSHIGDGDILGFHEANKLAGAQLFFVLGNRQAIAPAVVGEMPGIAHEGIAAAVQNAGAGEGNIGLLHAEQQVLAHPFFGGGIGPVLFVGILSVVII